MNFISTSVLSSNDGISFDQEKDLDNEEAKRAAKANAAPAKPLYEQLAEREAQKKEEYDRIGKMMNAPPRALDEEDVEHLEGVESRRRAAEERRKAEEGAAVSAFAAAQRKAQVKQKTDLSLDAELDAATVAPAAAAAAAPAPKAKKKMPVAVKVKKRKAGAKAGSAPKPKKKAKPAPSLLVGYSDDDSNSD
eukprot:CAMPEP_0118866280 /NCGR_PEP_ID=MMETSP1163-20130328/10249_1 /TAXON_ID=124430 /ORGANISM="Phaeomonas parva, Strain CCMP2877" /LENGTH=191 /DNA_ID=CAMNT_0006800581 /DNA_START=254 /DNA_END=829 /DNA_ORIENTATION=+